MAWLFKQREPYIFLFFIIVAGIIIYKLFFLTIIQHSYYKELARKQQTIEAGILIPRGNIYASNEIGKTLATSIYLYDLAIDPTAPWNKAKLKEFLTEIVYQETCYLKQPWECRENLIRFLNVTEIPDFKMNEFFIRQKIGEALDQKISLQKVKQVLLKEYLPKEEIQKIEALSLSWIFIQNNHLYANPENIEDPQKTANTLVSIIGWEKEDIQNLLKKRWRRYVLIYPKISVSSSELIKEKKEEEKIAVSRWFLHPDQTISQFIILDSKYHRFYPENQLAAKIIGFVDNQGNGMYGVEGYFNNILQWEKKQNIIIVDGKRGRINKLPLADAKKEDSWANITLTIDRNIQKYVEDVIEEDVKRFQANSISVIVMDPKTGYILAMASTPTFNPNRYGEVFRLMKVTPDKFPNPSIQLRWFPVFTPDPIHGKKYIFEWKEIFLSPIPYEEYNNPKIEKYIFVNKQWPGTYKNDIIQDLYEPGSIFKPILMASAIDAWEITPQDMYYDKGYVKVDKFTIKNVIAACKGHHTLQHAMNYSCNVGMIHIVQKLGKNLYYKYLDSFGFWKKTGITLEGEISWKLEVPEKWSKAQMFTMSYGLGIGVTQLQIATAYSTMVNGGIYYKPQIVKEIDYGNGKKIIYEPEPTHRVLKESTSKTMIDVLVDGVEKWEARAWKIPWYKIGWKTGTAQIAYKGRYEKWAAATVASYAWFWPAEDPRFVIIVKVVRPRTSEWWGSTAGETFNKIAKYLLLYYKIPPKK